MKKIIYILSIVLLSQTVIAQQNNTMYFMESLPQTKWLNPAIQNECKIHIGGALIPITGQVLLPIQYNYGSNGFAYKDIVQWNGDSLILPGYEGFDTEQLYDELRDVNFVTNEFHINYLTIGYKYKDWYFGFDIHDKVETHFSFNDDMLRFALEGNGQSFLGETAHLGDLAVNGTAYREYALSASKKINDKLTIGLSAKMLFGKMNIWTENSVIDIYTNDNDNYPMTVDADMLVHTSQPFFEVTEMYYDYEADSMVFESETKDVDYNDILWNSKNFGLGFDIGATYQLNKKIELYASLTDMGYIKWKDQTQTFSVKGHYYWDGYDFQPALTEDEELISDVNDSLKQDIIQIFEPEKNNDAYSTFLTPKAYIGGTYRFSEKIRTGLLLRAAFFHHDWSPSLTISGNFRLKKWFEVNASYSMINNTYTNIGLGFTAKAKWFQFFMMTDNLWGLIWPQATHNANFRMGINLIFGCKKKENTTLIGGK